MNPIDYLVVAIILILAALAVRYTIRRKKRGCGGCSGCAHSGSCPHACSQSPRV